MSALTKQITASVVMLLLWVWLCGAFIHFVLHDGWSTEWYGFPFAMTFSFGGVAAWVGGLFTFREKP